MRDLSIFLEALACQTCDIRANSYKSCNYRKTMPEGISAVRLSGARLACPGAYGVEKLRDRLDSVILKIFWIMPKGLEAAPAFMLIHQDLQHHLRFIESAHQARLRCAGLEQFLMHLGVYGGQFRKEFLDYRLFRLSFRLRQMGVRGTHGNIRQLSFRQIMHESHRKGLALIEWFGILIGEQKREQRYKVAMRRHGFRFCHPAQYKSRPGNPVEWVDVFKQAYDLLRKCVHAGEYARFEP